MHPAVSPDRQRPVRSAPFDEAEPPPNRLRWDPLPMPDRPADFIDGLATIGGNGDASRAQRHRRPHLPRDPADGDRVFYDADGELLIVPQQGRLLLRTEFGLIEAAPGEIAVIPRGVRFRVELPEGRGARLCLRKLRRSCCGCPNWGRSAPTGSPIRATS